MTQPMIAIEHPITIHAVLLRADVDVGDVGVDVGDVGVDVGAVVGHALGALPMRCSHIQGTHMLPPYALSSALVSSGGSAPVLWHWSLLARVFLVHSP